MSFSDMYSRSKSPQRRVTFDLSNGNSGADAVNRTVQNDKAEHANIVLCAAQERPCMSKKGSSIKKILVRHSECEVPTSNVVAKIHSDIQLSEDIESTSAGTRAYKPRYAVPELFSALCIAKELQDKKVEDKNTKAATVPVAVKQFLDGKASSKVNFSPDEQLFKNLVNLNVDDEVVMGAAEGRTMTWKLQKDEEPKLSDFYQPKFLGEYTSVPEPSLSAIGKIRNYNGFSTYKRIMALTLAERP